MKKLLLIAFLFVVAFYSCTKSFTNPTHKDRLQSIILGKDTLQLYVGQNKQLPVTITPSNYGADSIKWKSSDSTIISISNTGFLSAKKVGSAIVTVSNLTGTISLNCLINVIAAPVPPPPVDSLKVGLIAYYAFNNSGADSSGHGHNGTLYDITSVPDRFGNANAAYYFNGSNSSYIQVPDAQDLRLNNTDFTITLWVKLDTYNYSFGTNFISKRDMGANLGYTFSTSGYENTAALPGQYGFGPGGTLPSGTSQSSISTGQWTMVTVVYSLAKKQLTFYKNGVFDGTSANNIASPNGAATAVLFIGKDDPDNNTSYYLQGALDDIRIYSRALSAAQLKQLYNVPSSNVSYQSKAK
ncbi:LamG-like jellyroll fold domain-containing protein [Mucilaginibacter sp.]